jgi:phosphoglucosamine mutase
MLSIKGVREKGVAQAFASFRRFPQQLVNVLVARKPPFEEVPAITAKARAIETLLGTEGRLVLRYSGTEPLCRVMIEAADIALVEQLCRELAAVVQSELAK